MAFTTLSLNPATEVPTALGFSAMSSDGSTQTPSAQRRLSRLILSPHTRHGEGHNRKRSRLSAETTTALDTIEYWMDFDNDDGIPDKSKPRKSHLPPPVEKKDAAPTIEQYVSDNSSTRGGVLL